jgi:hypothetical protein
MTDEQKEAQRELTDSELLAQWSEIKKNVEDLELDIVKNVRGVASAGIRARKVLRDLRTKLTVFVRNTIKRDKSKKAEKKAAK